MTLTVRVSSRVVPGIATLALVVGALYTGCAASAPSERGGPTTIWPTDESPDRMSATRSLAGFENHFLLTWRGARMGEAVERVRRQGTGWRYERHERITVKRGGELVPLATHIAVEISAELHPERVAIKQISGSEHRRGQAVREPASGRWSVEYSSEPVRTVTADAVPAEIVAILLYVRPQAYHRGDVAWQGPVMLPGHGFAIADMRVVATGSREFAVSIIGAPVAGAHSDDRAHMRGRWRFTRYGSLARADDDNGVAAVRAHPRELAVPFEAPEMVLAAGIPVHGIRPDDGSRAVLRIEPVERVAAPPPLPGQRVHVRGRTWTVEFVPGDQPGNGSSAPVQPGLKAGELGAPPPDPQFRELAGDIVAAARGRADTLDRRAEVAALVRATDRLIADDLGATVTEARSALALGRGDCTAHATLFYELARARAVPARLVTGYRVDGDRLIRHRWALAAVDGAWLAVDPTHGEMPAQAQLFGLAVHGPSAADLAIVDETAFSGFTDAAAYWD